MKYILIFLLASNILSADTLPALFKRLENTQVSQKYKVVNQIKLKISKLNKLQRDSAIKSLKTKSFSINRNMMQQSNYTQRLNTLNMSEKTKQIMQDKMSNLSLQDKEIMKQKTNQPMNQKMDK